MSAPLIIITCIFHSVFVTLKMNFRLSIKRSPLTTTGNMDYILILQHIPYRMNIRLYSTALWYTSNLFEIWLLVNSLWIHLFHQNIIFHYILFYCLFSWRVVPCCDWLQCKYWLDTKWSTDIYCCFCELYILCCKWMCWNLMWVELCGNYLLLFLLSM